jgi:hypothetical protein
MANISKYHHTWMYNEKIVRILFMHKFTILLLTIIVNRREAISHQRIVTLVRHLQALLLLVSSKRHQNQSTYV